MVSYGFPDMSALILGHNMPLDPMHQANHPCQCYTLLLMLAIIITTVAVPQIVSVYS